MRVTIAFVCIMLGLSAALPVSAQVEAEGSATVNAAEDDGATTLTDPGKDSALEHWWLGAYYRYLWVPPFILDAFLDRGPKVANGGFGLVGTYRTGTGFNVEFGFGYMPLAFDGPLLAPGGDITDIELAKSDLTLVHATGSVMWDIEFHRTVALEIGVGLDLGLFAGDVVRNEAFKNNDSSIDAQFLPCNGPGDPRDQGEDADMNPLTPRIFYCASPMNGQASDPPGKEGEHYNVKATQIPPFFGFVMLPHIALRLQPFKYLAIKGEFAFGFATMFAGISLHGSFGLFEKGPQEIFVSPDAETVATGRVLGVVVEDDSGLPISGATVKLTARALSGLTTEADGRFIVDRLDAGLVRFDVSHPDYAPGRCEVQIPQHGGDAALQCHLASRERVGAISGQVQNEEGGEVSAPKIELTGPRTDTIQGDARGLFAAVDLPAGTYRLRIEADGYFVQIVELQIEARETAMPQIILTKQPKKSLVELRKEEIVITEQVQFKSGSAVILKGSKDLLSQVADVFLRHPQLERVEIQGHTDSKGSHQMNMDLSQKRAESVRAWLIERGVQSERLDAKGFGPDHPLQPNDTPKNRANNRRVQFIIRAQSSTVE